LRQSVSSAQAVRLKPMSDIGGSSATIFPTSAQPKPISFRGEVHFRHPDTKHEGASGIFDSSGYGRLTCLRQEHIKLLADARIDTPSSYGSSPQEVGKGVGFVPFANSCFFAINRPANGLPSMRRPYGVTEEDRHRSRRALSVAESIADQACARSDRGQPTQASPHLREPSGRIRVGSGDRSAPAFRGLATLTVRSDRTNRRPDTSIPCRRRRSPRRAPARARARAAARRRRSVPSRRRRRFPPRAPAAAP